jgi:hypothetical protein
MQIACRQEFAIIKRDEECGEQVREFAEILCSHLGLMPE